jgi:hypothetical protein
MQDVTVARLQCIQEYRILFPPSFKCNVLRESLLVAVLRIRIRIRVHWIHVFFGLLDPDPDPLVRGMDPDPDPSIIKQK